MTLHRTHPQHREARTGAALAPPHAPPQATPHADARPEPVPDPLRADERWLAWTIKLAVANVAQGGGPFGAVVVRADELVASGQNRVTRDNDPTAHAEVTAIRAACRELGRFSLAGATLYTSCEPCPLCLSAALWARLDRVVFSADRHDAARGGFDDLEFYELFARDRSTWPSSVEGLRVEHSSAPFDAWLASTTRTDY